MGIIDGLDAMYNIHEIAYIVVMKAEDAWMLTTLQRMQGFQERPGTRAAPPVSGAKPDGSRSVANVVIFETVEQASIFASMASAHSVNFAQTLARVKVNHFGLDPSHNLLPPVLAARPRPRPQYPRKQLQWFVACTDT